MIKVGDTLPAATLMEYVAYFNHGCSWLDVSEKNAVAGILTDSQSHRAATVFRPETKKPTEVGFLNDAMSKSLRLKPARLFAPNGSQPSSWSWR